MKPIIVTCFGSLHVQINNDEQPQLATDRARALLVYLLARPEQPHRREQLASLLWPDRPDSTARQNLRKTLSRLRQGMAPYEILQTDYKTVQLNHDLIDSDVTQFKQYITQLEQEQQNIDLLIKAVALYKGNFLEGFYLAQNLVFEEWLLLEREMWQQQVVQLLQRLAHHYEQIQETEGVIQTAQKLFGLDMWHENAHRQYMRALAQNGRLPTALAHYQTYAQQLQAELGVTPTSETEQLYHQLQQQKEVVSPTWHNFPAEHTYFVGRNAEIIELHQMLVRPEVGMVTIVGAGGAGKTRLALQVTRQLSGEVFQTIYFLPLATLTRAEQILPLIMELLDVPDWLTLLQRLAHTPTLLILDNFEHLHEEGRAVVSQLLETAVTLLVTSRHALNLKREWRLNLAGLPDATELFMMRAQRYGKHTFTPEEIVCIQQISQLVDGLPLAVEMAAAWLRAYDVPTLTQFLQENLEAWQAPYADVPARHQSMEAVFVGSWQLLSTDMQTLFGCLAVFAGGFSALAARAIAQASFLDLARLVDCSLVRMGRNGRYHIHALLRQFARQQQPLSIEMKQRMIAYYFDLLGQQAQSLSSPQPRSALQQLRPELANLEQAWFLAVQEQMWEALQTAVKPFSQLYQLLGRHQEFRHLLATARQQLGTHPSPLQQQLTIQYGDVLERLGQYEQVLDLAHTLIQQTGTVAVEGHFLAIRATIRTGVYDTARYHIQEAYQLVKKLNAPHLMVQWLVNAGRAANLYADYAQAQTYFQQLLHVVDLPRLQILAHLNLATVTMHTGQYQATEHHVQQATVLIQHNTLGGLDLLHTIKGALQIHLGSPDLAVPLLEKSIKTLQNMGDRWAEAISRYTLSFALYQLGELASSKAQMQQCSHIAVQVKDLHLQAFAYLAEGRIFQAQGDYLLAEQAYMEALKLRLYLKQENFIVGVRARLAEIYHLQTKEQQKQEQLQLLLKRLPTGHPHAILEPFYPYYICVQLAGSRQVALLAEERLLTRAHALEKPICHHYLQQPIHQSLLKIAGQTKKSSH